MLGIRGLDPFGLAHAIVGLAALAFGLLVITRPKGGALHRLWGSFYVMSMLLLNASALAIYDFTGSINTFHVFAVVSLATVMAGWIPALLRRPAGRWYGNHAAFMTWSYVGLVAAFVSEITTRLPVFGKGIWFGVAVGGSTMLVIGVGAVVIRKRLPRLVSRFATPSSGTASRA